MSVKTLLSQIQRQMQLIVTSIINKKLHLQPKDMKTFQLFIGEATVIFGYIQSISFALKRAVSKSIVLRRHTYKDRKIEIHLQNKNIYNDINK